jgi:hypothetical protein
MIPINRKIRQIRKMKKRYPNPLLQKTLQRNRLRPRQLQKSQHKQWFQARNKIQFTKMHINQRIRRISPFVPKKLTPQKQNQQRKSLNSLTTIKQKPHWKTPQVRNNQQVGRQVPKPRRIQQQRNPTRRFFPNPNIAKGIVPKMLTPQKQNQQRKSLNLLTTINQKPHRKTSQVRNIQQMGRKVPSSLRIQQQRNPAGRFFPNPNIANRIKRRTAGYQIKFFSPHELLQLAPQQDKKLWALIISRLPHDYLIPDPKFINLYKAFKNQKH